MPSISELPEVSIIIPTYNSHQFIRESIASVQAQTFANWELIISDDGSTDATLEIVDRIAHLDSRIRTIAAQRNQGPAAARNLGMSIATSRWLAFLDSDDLWLPTKLVETLQFAKARSSALTFTGYGRILYPDWRRGRDISCPDRVTYETMLRGSVINSSTVLLDRMKIPNFRWIEVYRQEDYRTWLEILRSGIVGYGLSRPLSLYRMGHQSRSSNKLRSAREVWEVYRRFEGFRLGRAAFFFANYAVRGFLKHVVR